jgi:hypothetical protein
MDEVKTRRNFIFPFSLVLPGSLFFAGKYPKHLNQRKKSINKDQLFNLWKGRFDLNIRYDHDIQPHASISEPVKLASYSEVLSLTVAYSLPVLNKEKKNY